MDIDDDKTPVDTPSAQLRLGLHACPLCKRTGKLTTGDECWYCKGGRVVDKARAEAWEKAHPPKPATSPDYDSLPDTLPASSNPPPPKESP